MDGGELMRMRLKQLDDSCTVRFKSLVTRSRVHIGARNMIPGSTGLVSFAKDKTKPEVVIASAEVDE